jgi:hypothetical protein
VNECGFVLGSGILLILPGILAQFLGVSATFITDHLMIPHLTELRVTPRKPRLPVIQRFLSDLSLIFPLNILDFSHKRAKYVRIHYSVQLRLPQFMDWVHPLTPPPHLGEDRDREISGPDLGQAPDAGNPAPCADAMCDTPDETELPERHIMDQVLDTGADGLDLTGCADAHDLDHSVDSALHVIDETVSVTLSGDPELMPYRASEQLLRLGEELTGVRKNCVP